MSMGDLWNKDFVFLILSITNDDNVRNVRDVNAQNIDFQMVCFSGSNYSVHALSSLIPALRFPVSYFSWQMA